MLFAQTKSNIGKRVQNMIPSRATMSVVVIVPTSSSASWSSVVLVVVVAVVVVTVASTSSLIRLQSGDGPQSTSHSYLLCRFLLD